MTDDNVITWRELNREGCEQGRSLAARVEMIERTCEEMKRKLDRMTWALVTTAIGFGTAALMLALNLLS